MKQNQIADLPKISLYRYENFFNVYQDKENKFNFYNLLKAVNIISSDNTNVEEEYTIKYNDTWGLISYRYYNTMDLWWVVCLYNQIKNPVTMPEVGTKIKLLKASYISTVIDELNKQFNR